jgi:hypothetical protein
MEHNFEPAFLRMFTFSLGLIGMVNPSLLAAFMAEYITCPFIYDSICASSPGSGS